MVLNLLKDKSITLKNTVSDWLTTFTSNPNLAFEEFKKVTKIFEVASNQCQNEITNQFEVYNGLYIIELIEIINTSFIGYMNCINPLLTNFKTNYSIL